MFKRLLPILALLCAGTVSAAAQTGATDTVYTTDSTGPQHGDLYRPAGEGAHPAIVFIHGGSWRSGRKTDFARLAADLARDGYVGLSIDYDLRPRSFPVAWEESRAAVRFLREHAAEYHVDPTRIAVVGTSAGGELAALTALAPNGPSASGDGAAATPTPVTAAVILNGVYDLCYPVHVIKRYMGGTCADRKAAYDDASPLRQVHPGAPPFFIGHGTRDHLVPFAAAQQFIAALRQNQDAVTVFAAQGGGHMYWRKKRFYQQDLTAIESFLATAMPGRR